MKFLEYIFSVRNNEYKTHKIITILGIKLKLKNKYKYIKNAELNNFGIDGIGKECVVLANGPSLKTTLENPKTYEFIKNRTIFIVNSFVSSEYFYDLKPKYIFIMDPNYWNKELDVEHNPRFAADLKSLESVDWELTFIMPTYAKEWNLFSNVINKNKHLKVKFINTNVIDIPNEQVKFELYKQNAGCPIVQSVLVAAIYTAINAMFEKIFVFGADHNWHKNLEVGKDNILYWKDEHFNDLEKIKYTPMYQPGTTIPVRISEEFKSYYTVFKVYEELEEYSKYVGVKIFNSSAVSFIDAFERKEIQ